MVGKIKRVHLREVWPKDDADFTPWLRDNIDVLSEVLDIDLSGAESEQAAGDLSVDILAEDADGSPVIIENQLNKSDHDHLGKLITYLTAIEARTAVWIVADPRPEHVKAIAWLNESSPASFYLTKVEAIRIGESEPAPLLTLIMEPSEEAREAGAMKQDWAEREILRHRFWSGLLDRARQSTNLHANVSPGRESWVSTGAGKTGLQLGYNVRQHSAYVELYIDRGKGAAAENKAIFEALFAHKKEIEERFGDTLDWRRMEEKQACRIRKDVELGGYRDGEERWPDIHDAMIDAMIRLEAALRPHIDALET